MELVKKYLESYRFTPEPTIKEEDYGMCDETLYNAHKINKLRVRARMGSTKVYRDNILLVEGYDYSETHDTKGSYIVFLHDNHESLRGSMINVVYEGYTLEGDVGNWN
jgi:hypothetical protein